LLDAAAPIYEMEIYYNELLIFIWSNSPKIVQSSKAIKGVYLYMIFSYVSILSLLL